MSELNQEFVKIEKEFSKECKRRGVIKKKILTNLMINFINQVNWQKVDCQESTTSRNIESRAKLPPIVNKGLNNRPKSNKNK